MLRLSISDGIEASHTHNLAYRVPAPIVGVRVGAQYATEVRLEPEFISSFALLAPLVYTEGLDGAGNGDVNAHVEAGECIVAAEHTLDDLVGGCLTVLLVGQCVYIGCEAGRGRGIDAGDMVVDARLEVTHGSEKDSLRRGGGGDLPVSQCFLSSASADGRDLGVRVREETRVSRYGHQLTRV